MSLFFVRYQPVSYRLDGPMGIREDLRDLIEPCWGFGVRVYIDAAVNHFTGAGNDRYTHFFTFQSDFNTNLDPSNEFIGAGIGTDDFHCDRALSTWTDLFNSNNEWLVGLTDMDTSKDNVWERQAAYLMDILSLSTSGFRFDAAKYI